MKNLATYTCVVFGFIVISNATRPPLAFEIKFVLIGMLLLVLLPKINHLVRGRHLGSLRIYFSDEGLYLQDPATAARNPWTRFIGYIEDDHVVLIYYNPRLYRIIPKRALMGRGAEFGALVRAKLPRFDYRHPLPTGKAEIASPPAPQV